MDPCDTFGKTVTFKLRDMEKMQRLYAENLIHQVLYKGLLNQLLPSTMIMDPQTQCMQQNTNPCSQMQQVPQHNQHQQNNVVCADDHNCAYIKVVTCE